MVFKSCQVFTARRYASAVYAVVVCPSVTRRYCTKTAKRKITQTKPYVWYDSQVKVFFWLHYIIVINIFKEKLQSLYKS